MKYISYKNLIKLLDVLKADYDVYVPVEAGKQRFYKQYDDSADNIVIGQVRAVEPLKSFFFRGREKVAEDFKPELPVSAKPKAIVGVKACDLKGFKIQDHVFKNHDYEDPFYINARRNNLIISADCTCTIDTCFCVALGVKPHPQEDFDINLSQIDKDFVVKTGSNRGTEIVESNAALFKDATQEMLTERDHLRDKVTQEVKANIKAADVPSEDVYKHMIEKGYESRIWQEEAENCVECGACNTICPTCHCFLLYDQKNEDSMARLRIWDSCMIKDFARVAGGANPREKLWMRLRNRFEKKFDFFPKVADVYACTGCGRCILACPAKIDIRKVLNKLVNNK